MSRTKVAIIIEVKKRELPFFCILEEILIKEGYEVKLIPFRSMCTWRLLKFRPDIIMVNGIRHADPYFYSQIALPKRLLNSKVICYYSEQIGYYDKSLANGYKNKIIFDNVDYHVSWGPRFTRDLEKEGVAHDKLWFIGSLQYDIDYYIKYSHDEIKKQLADKYSLPYEKKWILYADNIIKEYQPNQYYESRRKDSFDVIERVAKNNPDSIIIYRPHPDTSYKEMAMIKKFFERHSNVIFNSEGHAFYWTCAIDATIIWCSTSSIQAMFLKKPIFGFMTSDKQNLDRYWYRGILPLYESYSELANDVKLVFEGKEIKQAIDTAENRADFIKEWYFVKDGNSFNRIIALINQVEKSRHIPLSQNEVIIPKIKILRILYYELRAYVGDIIKGRDVDKNLKTNEIKEEKNKYDLSRYKHLEFEIRENESGKYFVPCQNH